MQNISKAAIRQVAFETTGQRNSFYWLQMRSGKLTASNFGKAISAMNNKHPSNILRLRNDMYHPPDLERVAAVRWGVDHEKQAIDEYVKESHAIVKPTGLWLFPNGIMGASPDGLVFADAHDTKPSGVIEVKCPYSMRDVTINCETEWHTHLKYLDCQNRLRATHQYYHQIQGEMYAVDVLWCDFIIWTPHNILIKRIKRDPHWGQHYLGKLEDFYQEHLQRDSDEQMDWNDLDDAMEVFHLDNPTRDLNLILNPVGDAAQELRSYFIQALHIHISRNIYQMLSASRSGAKWIEAVGRYWAEALDKICETCVRSLFRQLWYKRVKQEIRLEVSDVINEISGEEYIWSSLLYDPDFALIVRTRVKAYEPSYGTKQPACMCHPKYVFIRAIYLFTRACFDIIYKHLIPSVF